MITPRQLTDAVEQLTRLLTIIDRGEIEARPAEAAYLSGARDTLAAVLRDDDADGGRR